jgi:histidinol dehydrogenase
MLDIIGADGAAEYGLLRGLRSRAAKAGRAVDAAAAEIMEAVKTRGYESVREYSLRFDGSEPEEIKPSELDAAVRACPPELIAALKRAARNIRAYNERLLTRSEEWTSPDSGTVGRVVRGMTRVGIYVPGGTAAYPSSVLMNAVPAKVAGVEEIVMVTPPTENLNAAVLAAAQIAGVDRVIAVGGAQAVAALTYGAGFIPRVDKLVGPGNAFVAAAKRLAFGTVDIDMVAGPSEVLILADETANPAFAAADLLSQAEHDALASAILLTTCSDLASKVNSELERQLALLERADIIRKSLADFGACILCPSLRRAAELSNEIAPEHLEIMTENPREILPLIKNAGAVFLGAYSPEPLGDYLAGPDHVLPTSGTARFFSPLSAESFLKTMSVIEYTKPALQSVQRDIVALAEAERLTAHANSIRVRFGRGKK